MTTEIKLCPFCGGVNTDRLEENVNEDGQTYSVHRGCLTCGADGPEVEVDGIPSDEWDCLADAAWNQRAPQGEPVAWAPYIVDEDIEDVAGGLMSNMRHGLVAYPSEEEARARWSKYPIAPLYLSPQRDSGETRRMWKESGAPSNRLVLVPEKWWSKAQPVTVILHDGDAHPTKDKPLATPTVEPIERKEEDHG